MHSTTELARIFSSVRQAVIGLNRADNTIAFANSAAKVAFGFDPTGKSAFDIVPLDILTEEASEYLCGTIILDRRASISVLKESDVTLLFIDFLSEEKPSLNITRHMITSLRNSAMGIKLSADRCFSMLEEGQTPSEKYIAVLYHYYYSLLRTVLQIDSANLLERGELLFSPVPTDLVALCSELTNTVAFLCQETGVKINFSSEEQELIAVVDRSRIEQLLLNLFANSLQHTSAGNNILLTLSRTGNRIIISLDDDGDGIPQDVLPELFKLPDEADETSVKKSGNGLGLYISFGIAQLHKGVLLVESREGKGTRVRVMLPTDEEPAPKFNCPEVSYQNDDNSLVLSGLSDIISSSNYGPKYED